MKTTIRLIALATLVLFQSVLSEPNLRTFEVDQSDSEVQIEVELTALPSDVAPVRVPHEGVFISVKAPKEVVEYNILGSGLELDLNGDGDTRDRLKLKRENEQNFVGPQSVSPFAEMLQWQKTGEAEVYHLGEKAPGFIVYEAGEHLSVGLDFGRAKAGFEEVEGPFLQVMLLEACERAGAPATLKLEDSKKTIWAYEAGVEGPRPTWHRVQWQNVPANKPITLTITGKGEGLLVVALNTSPTPGVRNRRTVAVQPINL